MAKEGRAMDSNRRILEFLFETQQIELRRGPLFDFSPGPMPRDLGWGHVEGMLLGLAIGDALGNTTESQWPGTRRARFGEIRDYLPNRYADGRAVGLPSDDTQLAFWTLKQMLADEGFSPEHVAARFCRGRIFGIGSTVRQFVANCELGTLPWYRCGLKSAGNGALMRIAPTLLPHLQSGGSDVWVDTALSAMITHNDSASIAACLAFVRMLWELLKMERAPEPSWWLEAYVEAAKEAETGAAYRPRGGAFIGYEGPLWRFVEEHVGEAYRRGLQVLEACDGWYSGAYLLETMPSAIYVLMRHGADPEEAIVRAVNDTKDNDTIAAIVGAAVGALHGKAGLPERWTAGLLGRTGVEDEGRVFELIEGAKRAWWHS
jgi:ADP-ribosyl-[dinitrogen reductase] hydrolase